MTEQRTNWSRLTLEAVAIVFSILLAFAIEAWWSERQEQKFEEETIQALMALELKRKEGHRKGDC